MFKRKKKEVVLLQIAEEKCIGCESCIRRCRRKVLGMKYTDDYKAYAEVRYPADCIGCGKCLSVCSWGAIELITNEL
ncbi:Electron transport complex subunit RsxB [termite gut metagenome]|uniref:Electron transport complex subunit RsxB n=1 Tax=termite gut metagenome TaxID=433724 RepID=A0A5J4QK80_9ZZZZ